MNEENADVLVYFTVRPINCMNEADYSVLNLYTDYTLNGLMQANILLTDCSFLIESIYIKFSFVKSFLHVRGFVATSTRNCNQISCSSFPMESRR